MRAPRDPVERAADESADLYDVATWEPRSILDRLCYGLYAAIYYGLHWIVVLVAVLTTVSLLASPAVLVADEPFVGVFFGLSIVPALLLAGYIWYADVTSNEPLGLLVATFVLAVLFATFAAIVNVLSEPFFRLVPAVGVVLFYYLIVGPVEESVKLLAVRVLAFRSPSFDAVIDGAVYGAVAGLGFAAIENATYIASHLTAIGSETGLFTAATGIATVRALAGPGHVIYSAIAGYYLGLAKFNREYAGPLVCKGLLVAAFVHGTYNTTVQLVPTVLADSFPISREIAFVGYLLCFDLAVAYYLYRKIKRYRRTYRAVRPDRVDDDPTPEGTEFDPPNRRRR